MKNLTKEKQIIYLVAIVCFVFVSAIMAYAAQVIYPNVAVTPKPVVVEIDGSGNVLLRGTVESINGNSISVSSWGGSWVIRTGMSTPTEIQPGGFQNDVSSIAIGDFIGVTGVPANDSQFTIDASFIRNWTKSDTATLTPTTPTTPTPTTPITPSPTIPGETLYTGTASNFGVNSFVLTDPNGYAYSVNIDPINTVLWNEARSPIMFQDIQPGDQVRVNGALDSMSGTIQATVVRDISR